MSNNNFDQLPIDILEYIIICLDKPELVYDLCRTSKSLLQLFGIEQFWEGRLKSEFGISNYEELSFFESYKWCCHIFYFTSYIYNYHDHIYSSLNLEINNF